MNTSKKKQLEDCLEFKTIAETGAQENALMKNKRFKYIADVCRPYVCQKTW